MSDLTKNAKADLSPRQLYINQCNQCNHTEIIHNGFNLDQLNFQELFGTDRLQSSLTDCVHGKEPCRRVEFGLFPNPWSKLLSVYINAPRECTSEQSDKIKQFLCVLKKYHAESYSKMCNSPIEVSIDDLFEIDIPSMGAIDIGLRWKSN
jgi:hypothetical protein